jgi:hypothetical protein
MLDATGTLGAGSSGACFGVRQLTATYTGADINLRRGSDSASFAWRTWWTGNLNPVAIQAWAQGASLYDDDWYDQCGLHHDASQSTAADQSVFVPVTASMGGRPSVLFGSNTAQNLATSLFALNQPVFVSVVGILNANPGSQTIIDAANAANQRRIFTSSAAGHPVGIDAGTSLVASAFSAGVLATQFNGASSSVSFNNVVQVLGNAGANNGTGIEIGNVPTLSQSPNMNYGEVLELNGVISKGASLYANEKAYFGTP